MAIPIVIMFGPFKVRNSFESWIQLFLPWSYPPSTISPLHAFHITLIVYAYIWYPPICQISVVYGALDQEFLVGFRLRAQTRSLAAPSPSSVVHPLRCATSSAGHTGVNKDSPSDSISSGERGWVPLLFLPAFTYSRPEEIWLPIGCWVNKMSLLKIPSSSCFEPLMFSATLRRVL